MEDDNRRAAGIVVGDSAAQEPVGANINFSFMFHPPLGQPISGALGEWDIFHGAILGLVVMNNDKVHLEGSAFVVAPGVALTASHTMLHWKDALGSGGATLICMGITSKNRVILWDVASMTFVPASDICILSLRLASEIPDERTFECLIVSTRTPVVGEPLMAVGYRASELSFDNEGKSFPIGCDLRIGIGQVSNVFPERRDSVMLPWPTIEGDFITIGGMSGGPVFDYRGRVIGLLSSSIGNDDSEPGVSYFSQLWPGLAAPFSASWPNGIHLPNRPLLEMIKLCQIEGRQYLQSIDGQYFYTPWSNADNLNDPANES